jgi:hypothetical protein
MMKMKQRAFIVLTIMVLSSGCMKIAWMGYKKPQESDFVNLNATNQCMRIGTQNLDDTQKQAILEAASAVCQIFTSKEFEDAVVSRNWLLSCDYVDGNPDVMSGYEVLNLIRTKIRDYSINPYKPWKAIAQTQRSENDIAFNRVAITPARIAGWSSSDKCVRAKLVNTIAHETMHIISSSFRDRGHGSSECPDERLVSYGIGNLVAQIWIENKIQGTL